VAVVRVHPSGALDKSLRGGGADVIDLGPFSYAYGVAVEPNGKTVIAGSQSPGLQVTNALVARLTRQGALDHSFNGSGSFARQFAVGAGFSSFNAVAIHGGKVIVAGAATNGQTSANALVARFTGSGRLDGGFGSNGLARLASASNFTVVGTTVPGATSVTVTPGGEVFAAGQIANGILGNLAVWALTGSGRHAHFGSGGVVTLHRGRNENSEGAAVAWTKKGTLLVAGDENPAASRPYKALVASFKR
jgi:uncharacterized delta-60 repeat protein